MLNENNNNNGKAHAQERVFSYYKSDVSNGQIDIYPNIFTYIISILCITFHSLDACYPRIVFFRICSCSQQRILRRHLRVENSTLQMTISTSITYQWMFSQLVLILIVYCSFRRSGRQHPAAPNIYTIRIRFIDATHTVTSSVKLIVEVGNARCRTASATTNVGCKACSGENITKLHAKHALRINAKLQSVGGSSPVKYHRRGTSAINSVSQAFSKR